MTNREAAELRSVNKIPKIYTDGSCLGGPSGWSFCVDHTWLVSGGVASSTNNRMELQAVIEALDWITEPECIIYTDSLLTLKCAKGIWKRKANMDLWSEYDRVSRDKIVHWNWVKAHNGDELNELVDVAARAEAKLQKNKNS